VEGSDITSNKTETETVVRQATITQSVSWANCQNYLYNRLIPTTAGNNAEEDIDNSEIGDMVDDTGEDLEEETVQEVYDEADKSDSELGNDDELDGGSETDGSDFETVVHNWDDLYGF
jgi:hypothetical protein